MTALAVIGGTGTGQLPGFEIEEEVLLPTPWGDASHPALRGRLEGRPLWFLPRHGQPHSLPPHAINYRANLWLLKEVGVESVLSINAVGGMTAELVTGSLMVPNQVIDYTWGRQHTIYDGSLSADGFIGGLEHIDFSDPYAAGLRQSILSAAASAGVGCVDGGTYCATQGPRLESAAEIIRLRRDGGDVVGMTGMPETALARELALEYASLCVVVNPAAGLTDEEITLVAMKEVLERAAEQVSAVITQLLAAVPGQR
jgi:5'-methylthioinosine phosphorylase